MGSVLREKQGTGYDMTDVFYLYCDKCGSFSIAKRPNLAMVVSIVAVIGVPVLIWKINDSLTDGMNCFWGLLVLFILILGLVGHGHYCSKCGNMHITEGNPRDYAEYDSSVVDVPDRLTYKHNYF